MGDTQEILNKIDGLAAELKALQPLSLEHQKKLDLKFRLEFNFNSNHIEGNTLTYGETELLLIFDGTKGNHTSREYDEMKAHDVAYYLMQDWANESDRPLTERDIKNLNETLLVRPFWKEAITPDGQNTRRMIKVGDYKEYPNNVRLQNGEIFEYASVVDTPILMGELIKWYRTQLEKQELHPVALAALLHYKFVRIHPFDDGNGRISRLLMNYILLKNDFPPIIVKSADKRNYLMALNNADTGDLNAFIQYIAQQLIWSLELSIKAAKGESIEEPDDLEKEIALWKKQAATKKIEAIRKDDGIIYEIYTKGIQELFEQFNEKLKQFHDMFKKISLATYKNSNGNNGLEWLNNEMDKIAMKLEPKFYNEGESPDTIVKDDSFRNISIQVNLQEYKYSENVFNITPKLHIQFEPYKYVISYPGNSLVKKYTEFLNADERKQILIESVKYIFEDIKNSTK